MENKQLLETINVMMTNTDTSVYDLSYQHPILLVFLRRFGCTFCREAMNTLSEERQKIEALGTRIVLVHMGDEAMANKNWETYNLQGIWHVADPKANFYQDFGLMRGSFKQLFGLTMWMDGIQRGAFKKYGVGALVGDGFQMPGAYMIQNGQILDSFVHKSVSDQPDYYKMLNCCVV